MNSEAQAGGAVGDVEVSRRWSDGGRSPMDGEAQAGGAVGDVEVTRRWSDGGRSPMNADEARVVELCDDLLAKLDPKSTPHAEFLGAQYDLGLAWVHFPEGLGGLGVSPKPQKPINAKV